MWTVFKVLLNYCNIISVLYLYLEYEACGILAQSGIRTSITYCIESNNTGREGTGIFFIM